MISVWRLSPSLPSGRWNLRARPRGLDVGSVSGITGSPVEEEKRRVMGVEGEEKCGAEERREARGVGVKVPVRRRPFAWAGRKDWELGGWAERRVERREVEVERVRGSGERGILVGSIVWIVFLG